MKKLINLVLIMLFVQTANADILEYNDRLLHADYICAENATPKDNHLTSYNYSNNTLSCHYQDLTKKTINNLYPSIHHSTQINDRIINVVIVKDDPTRNYNKDYDVELNNAELAIKKATNIDVKFRTLGVLTSDFKVDFDDGKDGAKMTDSFISVNVFKNSFYYEYMRELKADLFIFLINDDNGNIRGLTDSFDISASNGLEGKGFVIANDNGNLYDKNNYLYTHEMGHLLGLSHDILTRNKSKEEHNCGVSDYFDNPIPYGIGGYDKDGYPSLMSYSINQLLKYESEDREMIRNNEFSKSNENYLKIVSINDWHLDKWGCKYKTPELFPLLPMMTKLTRSTLPNSYIPVSNAAKALEITVPMLLNRNTIDENNLKLININLEKNDFIYLKDKIEGSLSEIGNDNFFVSTGELNNSFDLNLEYGDNTVHIPYLQSLKNKTLIVNIEQFNFNDKIIISNEFNNFENTITEIKDGNNIIGFKLEYFDLTTQNKALSLIVNFENSIKQESDVVNLTFEKTQNVIFETYAEDFYNVDGTGTGMIKDFRILKINMDNIFKGSENSDSYFTIGGTSQSDSIYGLGGDDVLGSPAQTNSGDWWLGNLDLTKKDYHGDAFYGGLNNDHIYGTRYGDYYYYVAGDGVDTIFEKGDVLLEKDSTWSEYIKDVVVLENIYSNDFEIKRNGYDVIIDFKNTTEQITIKNGLKQYHEQSHIYYLNAIEEVSFADGYYSFNDIIKQALIVKGTQNNDVIRGLNEYVNTFESSLGFDTYIGSTNDDVYNISSNVSSLTIQESSGNDEINFIGLTDLTFIEEDGNVNVYDLNNNLIVKIEGFTSENNLIETINVDGVSYTSATFDDLIEKSNYSFIQIDCGDNHCLAIDTNNEMWFSGDEGMMNNSGFFGDGSNRTFTTTWQNSGIKNVSHIEAMQLQSYYISNGEVYYAGFDNSNFTVTNNWKKLSGISNVKKLASNGTTTLALTESGEVFAIGGNMSNEAGVGSSSTSSWARAKTNSGYVTGATDIAIGSFQSFVLIGDEVYSAGTDGGSGNLGRTGNGDVFQSTGLTGVSQIASGNESGYALKSGVVYSVGYNKYGELGLGHRNNKSSFTSTGLTDVSHISASGSYIIALKNNSIYFSGVNYYGQAGNGSSGIYDSFVKTMSPNFEIDNIEADYSNMTGFTILWSKNSDVAYSGGNYAGQAGDGSGVDTKNMISYTISE